jgi:hypothetical protein
MVDVVLLTDELTVLGGPSSISVTTDFGATGARGSLIFVNSGSPTITGNVPQSPNLLDTYINVLPTDPNGEYLTMYQYQLVNGENTWVPLVKLGPDMYSSVEDLTFTSGSASLSIPLSSITSQSGITESDLNVQLSIDSGNPISVGKIVSITAGQVGISISASQLSSSTWSALSGDFKVNLTITVV